MNARIARLLVMTTSMLLISTPAHADGELELSRDGSSWSENLTGGLFDPALRWVPGDARTASFYVRNQSSAAGRLTVDLRGTSVDSLLETGDLSVAAKAGGSAWHSISTPGRHRLATSRVASGARQKVSLRVSFDPRSTNVSRVKRLDLDLDVRLSQVTDPRDGNGGRGGIHAGDGQGHGHGHGGRAGVGGADGSGANGSGDGQGGWASDHGLLPNTGATLTLSALLAAAAALLIGSWLVAARRRREEAGHE